ncbi:flagellar biosynthetic protein FliO [Panacagrimonas sp.]|uniref:flagellar biosynthetic protein FliO n=1 Tax=Panacagrimonas sp. TaxID=2480088 RepID=UPI003B51A5D1
MENAAALLQMVLSLAAVVAMILGLAWMTRRMQGMRAIANSELRVRSTLAVGLKERVVIVEAQGQQFLIGVAPGQVSILKSLGPAEASSPVSRQRSRDAQSQTERPLPIHAPASAVAEAGYMSDASSERLPSFREAFALQLRQAFKR